MFAPANQTHFKLTIQGLQYDLDVVSFKGMEAISQPFQFDVKLVSEHPSLHLEELLHKPAFLQISPDGGGIHGRVGRAAQGERGKRLHTYEITLRPQLAYLSQRSNVRIFQDQTVPHIIAQVLQEHGILADSVRFAFRTPYPARAYCVQYNETDLTFIQRLCEEEGIHYHFQHGADGCLLVFGDDQTVFRKLDPVAYHQDSGLVADAPVVNRFKLRVETRPSRTTQRGYRFETPRLDLEATSDSLPAPDLESYHYPGRFIDLERGKRLAERALQRHRSDHVQAQCASNQPRLSTGHFLPLTDHPQAIWNDLWLLTEIIHEGHQPQALEESAGMAHDSDECAQGYRNHFLATPWDTPFRPALTCPRPRIVGTQSAVVVGPAAEEIHCDEYGRVKVQFHWDRQGQRDDRSSCWLRVSSGWAGAHYGGIAVPRVGMEVLVSFLEGDPDQPLISGCLYHGEHAVPYDLPTHKTRSLFRSMSSPGGGGANELRIEDLSGQEQIYVRAQRDWDQQIENEQRIHVGNQRHDTVVGDSHSEFKADEHHSVHGNRQVETRADDHLSVGNSQHLQVGDGQLTDAGMEIHLDSGLKVVLHAGSELTLKAGGHFLTINSSGLTSSVPITVGGAPGQGTPAAPLLPGPLRPVERGRSGELLMSPEYRTFSRSAPSCEICERANEGGQ